jgi:hypothetical protein
MNDKAYKKYLVTGLFAAVAIFCQVCSRAAPAQAGNQTPVTTPRQALDRIVWTADENTFRGPFDSNGLAAVLWITSHSYHDRKPALSCTISLINESTNHFFWCWKGAETNFLKIDLLNSDGMPVEKTAKGLQYGEFLTQQQLETFFKSVRKPVHLQGYVFVSARELGGYQLASFRVPELFKLTEPGEYTLRVRIRLAQRDEKTSKMRRLISPPEVTARFQIRSKETVRPQTR